MLEVIRDRYRKASQIEQSKEYADEFLKFSETINKKILEICEQENIYHDEDDDLHTQKEWEEQSDYRKFCIKNNLALSEHSLYCPCYASSKDSLSIITYGVSGGLNVPQMGAFLNKLKSEFSFARKLYYEYLLEEQDDMLLTSESGFSDLNYELLGVKIERIKSSFHKCFSILDKIAEGLAILYKYQPKNKNYRPKLIDFFSFWDLTSPDFDYIKQEKSPGLIALYSIATDLEQSKGEFKDYKKWRNKIEHSFLVIYANNVHKNIIDEFTEKNSNGKVLYVNETDFVAGTNRLLSLTRASIFYFTYAVRYKLGKKRRRDHDSSTVFS